MSYRNPSPPPGYKLPSPVKFDKNPNVIDGIHYICQDLLLESGIFDATDSLDDFIIMTSEEEDDEVQVIIKKEPEEKPEYPEIDLTLADDLCEKVKIENTSDFKEKKVIPKEKEKKKKREKRSSSSSSESHSPKPHAKPKSKSTSSFKKNEVEVKSEKIKTEKIKTENIKMESVVKTEKNIAPDMLYGQYKCDLCKAFMNSYAIYQTHINGKRHLKNLKLKNTAEVVSKTIAPTKVESRYPPPPAGVCRVKVSTISQIQSIVDKIKTPMPGLHKVTEIQGIQETVYYCELCDAPCAAMSIVPHLQGHRHQLRSVKYYEPEIYERICDRKNHEIERRCLDILRDAERRYGRGLITVEKEFEGKEPPPFYKYSKSGSCYTSRIDQAGPSYRDPEDAFPDHYALTTIPDTSKSDFYCKLCDSHMNCEQMWEAHIRGKRHLTNAKKAPGVAPSKTRSVPLHNQRAKIMDELDHIDEPIVGLDEMRETQNPIAQGEMYNCFLCGACMTTIDVIDHILSLKHRRKYLEKIRHPDMLVLKDITMQESRIASIIEEICAKVEQEFGQGKMEVHIMKNAVTW